MTSKKLRVTFFVCFWFLESKAKSTPPYPHSLLPSAQEKGLWFSFHFIGLATFAASFILLSTRPSSLSLTEQGTRQEEV